MTSQTRQAHGRPFRAQTLVALRGSITTMKDTMFHNKIVFSSVLSDQFRISSKWRASRAKRFKHDVRNAAAEKRLLDLESQIDISDETWTRIAPLVSDSNCLAAISDTNRDVEFRTYPRDFAAWLDNLHHAAHCDPEQGQCQCAAGVPIHREPRVPFVDDAPP